MKSGRAPLSKFKPYPQNARTHPKEEIDLLSKVIKERGADQPIVVDEDWLILKGHGRLEAAKLAGLADFPYVQRFGLSEADKKAIRIEDNSLPLLAGWNKELLAGELATLQVDGYDLKLLGFPDAQLVTFMAGVPSSEDPEATPEPTEDPVSRPGDLWIMGRHRLLCGDSTKEADVAHVLGGEKPNLMVTDPPYGVDYDADWRNQADRANGKPYGARAIGTVENDHREDWTDSWKLFPGNIIYCWHAGRHASRVQSSLEVAGFEMVAQIVWAKTRLIISRGDYHWQHEPCWYAVRKGKKHAWAGDRSQTTLWQIEHAKSETGHSTQKPIECMRRPIQNNSQPGDYVYEPFSGSGTTIIAAEMMNRYCLAIELSPAYVDVAVQRWQAFAKGEATLAGDGRTFEQIAEARKKPRRRTSGAQGAAKRSEAAE